MVILAQSSQFIWEKSRGCRDTGCNGQQLLDMIARGVSTAGTSDAKPSLPLTICTLCCAVLMKLCLQTVPDACGFPRERAGADRGVEKLL